MFLLTLSVLHIVAPLGGNDIYKYKKTGCIITLVVGYFYYW
jgi:hypothetical protein